MGKKVEKILTKTHDGEERVLAGGDNFDVIDILGEAMKLVRRNAVLERKVADLNAERNRLLVDLYNQGRQMDEMAQMIGYQQMEIRRLEMLVR